MRAPQRNPTESMGALFRKIASERLTREDFGAALVFAEMQKRIERNPALAQRMNAVFQFNIAGESGGAWVVDLKETPGVRAGAHGAADVTITMQDGDFVAMTSGNLNPMSAFAQGKIKVQGNVMLASKLQQLFS